MGNQFVADNQEVEHESGASRMGSAICCAAMSPFLMLACVILIGWNEKRAVCDAKAIYAGKEVVNMASCNDASANSGDLVLFTCTLDDPTNELFAEGKFAPVGHVGYCLQADSEMYQCKERVESKTTKDSVGGGKTTVKTYYYSKEWSKTWINSAEFQKKDSQEFRVNCNNQENPQWDDAQFPKSNTKYANEAKAEAWTLTQSDLQSVLSCGAVEVPAGSAPVISDFNFQTGTGYYESTFPSANPPQIGGKKIRFTGDAKGTKVTALGKNTNGKITEWEAPDSWLCSGYKLKDMRSGTHDKDQLFEKLVGENTGLTWGLRILGFALLWLSCTCLGRPLEVAADCIPCIGPMLGDFVDAVVCCVTCLPALACCAMVAGVVWVAMRPAVGAPILIAGMCIICGAGGYKVWSDQNKNKSIDDEESGPKPATMGNASFSGPVNQDAAVNFLKALRIEYLGLNQDVPFANVGDFFAQFPETEEALGPYEERVRDSENRAEQIRAIEREWNLPGASE